MKPEKHLLGRRAFLSALGMWAAGCLPLGRAGKSRGTAIDRRPFGQKIQLDRWFAVDYARESARGSLPCNQRPINRLF